MKSYPIKKYFLMGFTIIELLVVITIIGLLVTVATVSYLSTVKRSRDSRRRKDITLMRDLIETYRAANKIYPSTIGSATNTKLVLGDCQQSTFKQNAINIANSRNITPPLTQSTYQSGRYYIPDLVPQFTNSLPIDPQNNPPPDTRLACYIYESDGFDYKIRAASTVEIMPANPQSDPMYDPSQNKGANTYAVYSIDAKLW